MGKIQFMQGNEAITEGAIAAGARFYAGYPITPSSEIAETSSVRLPQVGGIYVQMEDEIGSIAALIGASCSGKKAYTATSGPGISLMSENIGVAVMAEIPCVIIDVQRCGPSTGLATKPAQGDLLQVRWGTHGDHAIIALSPSTVQDCFDLMITAFNYAEQYRTPVVLLADEMIGHLREQIIIRDPDEIEVKDRKMPNCDPALYKPYDHSQGLAPLAYYGSPYVFRANASMHDESSHPCDSPENADYVVRHLTKKIESHCDELSITREYQLDDAEIVVIAYGGVVRAALSAVKEARELGIKAGLLQLITVWPVSNKAIQDVMGQAEAVVVPEMNLGQYIGEICKRNSRGIPVIGVNKVNSKPILPSEILNKIQEVSQ